MDNNTVKDSREHPRNGFLENHVHGESEREPLQVSTNKADRDDALLEGGHEKVECALLYKSSTEKAKIDNAFLEDGHGKCEIAPLHASTDKDELDEAFIERQDALNDMDTGWAWLILFASFGNNALTAIACNSGGIMFLALKDIHNEGVAKTAFVGVLQSAVTCLAAPIGSILTDRYSCRVTLMVAGVLYTVGTFLTAFAPNIDTVIFTLGIVSGTGSAFGYTAGIVVLSYNFKKRRNFALSVCATGGGVGIFVFPALLQVSRDYYGSRGMFIIFAALVANMVVLGALCSPSKMEVLCKKQRNQRSNCAKNKTQSNVMKNWMLTMMTYLNVLLNKGVILLSLSTFSFYLSIYTLLLYLPAFVVSTGISELHASMVISLIGALSIVGRLLTGIVANMDWVDDLFLHSGSMAIISAAIIFYAFASGYAFTHALLAVVIGLLFGTSFILSTSVSLPFVGVDFISVTLGVEFFFGGVGSIIGPIITGLMLDAGGTYQQCFFLVGGFGAAAAVFSAMTTCGKPTKSDLQVPDITIKA